MKYFQIKIAKKNCNKDLQECMNNEYAIKIEIFQWQSNIISTGYHVIRSRKMLEKSCCEVLYRHINILKY